MNTHNTQVLLHSRPHGPATLDNFQIVQRPLGELAPGQVLVRNHYLSLDPYMRNRMREGKSYAPPQALNEVMVGDTVGEVIASADAAFEVGEPVLVVAGGWQTHTLIDAIDARLQKLHLGGAPLRAYLGPLGLTGVTAWYGVNHILAPQPGHTVVVSAANGAVGSVAGQLLKAAGVRVVGIAGGPEKCAYVRDRLGLDDCIDHRLCTDDDSAAQAVRAACPEGVDGCFENVGGRLLDAVIAHANPHARIALCGTIAGYNDAPVPISHPAMLITSRIRLQGFIISDHLQLWPEAVQQLRERLLNGMLHCEETVVQGIELAPAAFLGLFDGRHRGKLLVQLV